MGNVLSMEACSPELRNQFEVALGEEFSLRALKSSLRERSVFREARGVLHSFVPDLYVRNAMTETYETTYFVARCEPDYDQVSEIAEYSVSNQRTRSEYETQVDVTISPNALNALFHPISGIVETLSPRDAPLLTVDQIANVAYRSIYAKTLAQFVVMKHMIPAFEDPSLMTGFKFKIDHFFTKKFGKNGIEDLATHADHLAMAFGGAVMYRQTAKILEHDIGKQSKIETQRIGQFLKMYAAGLGNVRPLDQQSVTFPLVHAFTPNEAASFLKAWFA